MMERRKLVLGIFHEFNLPEAKLDFLPFYLNNYDTFQNYNDNKHTIRLSTDFEQKSFSCFTT